MTYQRAEPIVARYPVSLGGEFGADRSWVGPPSPPTHTGVDHLTPTGVSVPAMLAGVVVFAGWADALSGVVVRIIASTGESVLHAHLSPDVVVVTGDRVELDQLVARSGNTGSASTGPHLHTEYCADHRHLAGVCYAAGTLRDPLVALKEGPMLTEERVREIAKEETRAVLANEAWLKDAIRQAVANAATLAVGQTLTRLSNAIQKALAAE